MSDRLLQFEDIYYTYPGSSLSAIQGLTLAIPARKKSVILGHNGSGKSTLLLLADGLYQPDRGVVSWRGEPLRYRRPQLNSWRQRIGLAFQDPEQQLVAGTVAEDISYGLCNLQLPPAEIEAKLERAIADFHLEAWRDRPLHHLSLGQKRRVALAGVMALQPELLLLDEPTAYLDHRQTCQLQVELERIYQGGTTIVIATHDLNFAYTWADWFFLLQDGQLVLQGEADEIFRRREVLEDLHLGMPLLWEVWETLSSRFSSENDSSYPKTIAELRERLLF